MPVSKQGIKALAQIKEGLTSGDWGSVDVDDWLIRASMGASCTPEEIMDRLLGPQDVDDLRSGQIGYDVFKCYVRVWCEMGKPRQNMIEATQEEVKAASDKVREKFKGALDGLAKK